MKCCSNFSSKLMGRRLSIQQLDSTERLVLYIYHFASFDTVSLLFSLQLIVLRLAQVTFYDINKATHVGSSLLECLSPIAKSFTFTICYNYGQNF